MTDNDLRLIMRGMDRAVGAIECIMDGVKRIADALEAANAADPVRAIAAALEAEQVIARYGEPVRTEAPADLPPAQRRAMGLE